MKKIVENNMTKILITVSVLFICFGSIGCSPNKPSNSIKEDQYEIINQNIKKSLGNEYSAINFIAIEEGFTNNEKSEYLVKITFDLNKSYMLFDGKRIPGELKFTKNENKDWVCVYNSAGNALSFLNFIKGQ